MRQEAGGMRVVVVRWCGKYRVGTVVEGPDAERLLALYPHRVERLADGGDGEESADDTEVTAGE